MASQPRPLHVLLVSLDASLLHEISWVLDVVGYKVQTTGDFGPDALWRRYALADFVIIDGRKIIDPTTTTFAHETDNPVYRIFLYDPAVRIDVAAWYSAGAHDGLRTPLSRGELLARMRTGARYLEFERRLHCQTSRCSVPGMFSRRGLLRKLRKLAATDDGLSQHTLLATSIDWYQGIRRKNGETASRSLISAAGRAIRRAVGENAVSAYLGAGRFATLLVGQSPAAVKGIAESLAKEFGSRESHHEAVPRPMLTSAATPWTTGCTADRFFNDALETLDLAEHSGGNCVVFYGDFQKEIAAWQQEMSTGNPFLNVVAQDIMEPFPTLLDPEASQDELAATLRFANVDLPSPPNHNDLQTHVAFDEASIANGSSRNAVSHAGGVNAHSATIPFDASFPDIYDAFSSRDCATLVVTANDRPLGYITCDGFLSMIDPIHSESFANTDKTADDLAYLVVPSLVDAPTVTASV